MVDFADILLLAAGIVIGGMATYLFVARVRYKPDKRLPMPPFVPFEKRKRR